jgi:hypothetical protein
MRTYRRFADILELIAELKRTDHVWYQTPLDASPRAVHVRQYTISNVNFERSRATLHTKETGPFVVNLTQHFDRFRMPEIGRVP